MINAENLVYEYIRRDENDNIEAIVRAVDGVTFNIKTGDFVTILGHNGSGKSTMAKMLNAILVPTEGTLVVGDYDAYDDNNILNIRQTAGMVFQNPDNQIIGQIVEEDVGFGPENLQVPTEEIWRRVEESLTQVGMIANRYASPNRLSGGQKQRVAIAGILAMRPKCIILDEPTAMLDPNGRKEVINTVRKLNEEEGITVLLITHHMEEAIYSDRVIVVDKGKIVMEGTPKSVFSRVEELREHRLDVPPVTELAYELRKEGLPIEEGILTAKELLCQLSLIM